MQHKEEASMSHVDEGMLHAYLDGELPAEERSAVEVHLAQCEACRARLGEERALVERASALLGAVRPRERPVPPFEAIRRQPNRSPWRVRRSFAWAASIALALGFGYYLHDVGAYQAAAPQDATPLAAVSESRALDTVSSTQRDEHKASPTTTPAREEVAMRQRFARRDSVAPGRVVGGRVDSGSLKVATGSALASAAAPHLADSAPVVVNGVTASAVPRAEADRPAAAPAPSMQLTERVPSANTWPRIDRETAKDILGEDPVGLPDITTRTFRRSPDREGVVVVEQELDPRTTIQIFQQSPRARSSVIDSMVSGNYFSHRNERERGDRLARYVGKLRVEIGGPVSVDSLNRLLDLVRPLP